MNSTVYVNNTVYMNNTVYVNSTSQRLVNSVMNNKKRVVNSKTASEQCHKQ